MKKLMDLADLHVELRAGNPSRMILKGTYGEKIHKIFGVTRQGMRWRFQHIFGHAYVRAFETILLIEKIFGTELREYAIRISREKYQLRQKVKKGL
ncbi:MAG: hypothetical protein WC770_10035 [Phycisphaerae bacterium]